MSFAKTAARLLLGRRLPVTSGQIEVPGIEGPVTIRRDRFGVPHIGAQSDTDAFYGIGFCHGQDRTFQLELLLRLSRGTLAELVGPEALAVDRLARRVGFWRSADARLPLLDEETAAALAAYAAGVNAGWEIGLPARPHEFVLLRAAPTPFQPADVLAILALEGFLLAANWDSELARLKVLSTDGEEALHALDPAYPEWHPLSTPPGDAAGPALDRLAADVEGLRSWAGLEGGSNTWAVAPGRTATGRPLLANDPHLAPLLPPHWYLCHLVTPRWALAGASFVGTPGVPAGHNGHAAWGVTAGLVDNTDLYIEEIGSDGRSVRRPEGFVPCRVYTESIGVRNGDTAIEDVLVTDRGPIIGPALAGELGAISLQATWLEPRPIKGLLALHRVRNFEEFRTAMAQWPAATLGMSYADADGHIGYLLAGEAPVRRTGGGTIPLPAWSAGVGWESEPVDPGMMPYALDPESGFVATANNRPAAGREPYLGVDWIDGYRVGRIVQVLSQRDDWDLYGTMDLQLDQVSLVWRELRSHVLPAIAGRADLDEVHRLLEEWDGVVGADSEEAALFELLLAELDRRIVLAKAPGSAEWALGRGFTSIVPFSLFAFRRAGLLVTLLRERPTGWFARGWDEEIAGALAQATRSLGSFGDRAQRTWGRVRPLVLRHPLAERPPLDQIFNLGPLRWGGDANTVSQAGPDPLQPAGPTTVAIASLRMTIDVGDWERCRFVLPGGQSGNPYSPHYADQLGLWEKGDGLPIPWADDEVEAATHDELRLVPPP